MSDKITLTSNQLDNYSTEGNKAFADMEVMAKALGYDADFGPVFDDFLADNPGCVEAIYNWVRENYAEQIDANDQDEAAHLDMDDELDPDRDEPNHEAIYDDESV